MNQILLRITGKKAGKQLISNFHISENILNKIVVISNLQFNEILSHIVSLIKSIRNTNI